MKKTDAQPLIRPNLTRRHFLGAVVAAARQAWYAVAAFAQAARSQSRHCTGNC